MEVKTRRPKPSSTGETPIWNLAYLDVAWKDARRFLDDDQYEHAVGLFDQLALEEDPRHSEMLDVRPVEGFWELRDKGGVLGKINLRVYFMVDREHKTIVVLGCDKKERENKIALHVRKRIENRLVVARRLLSQ